MNRIQLNDTQPTISYADLSDGDIFTFEGTVYILTEDGAAVSLATGFEDELSTDDEVTILHSITLTRIA